MSRKQIPAHEEITCDRCGVVHMKDAKGVPDPFSQRCSLKFYAEQPNYQFADPTVKDLDFCNKCIGEVELAISTCCAQGKL